MEVQGTRCFGMGGSLLLFSGGHEVIMADMAIRPDTGENLFSKLIRCVGAALDAPVESTPDELTLKRWQREADRIPNDGLRGVLNAQLSLLRGHRYEAEKFLDEAFQYATMHYDPNADVIIANAMVVARRMLDLERLEQMHAYVERLTQPTPSLLDSAAHTLLLAGDVKASLRLMERLDRMTGTETMKTEKSIAMTLNEHLGFEGLLKDYRLMKQAILQRMHEMGLTVIGDDFQTVDTPEGTVLFNRINTREPVADDPSVAVIFETDIAERVSPRLADKVIFTVTQHSSITQ